MRGLILAVLSVCLWPGVVVAAPDFSVTGLGEGQAVSGALRVSAAPVGATLQSFTFTLLTAASAIVSSNQEFGAPYCFIGDPGVLPCNPFDTTTLPNGTYAMRILMLYSGGAMTKQIGFTIANGVVAPPGKPSAPVAQRRDVLVWSLFWTNMDTTQTGLRVERAPSVGGPFTTLTTLPATAESYDDRSVTYTDAYCWRLYALKGTVASTLSSNVACTP